MKYCSRCCALVLLLAGVLFACRASEGEKLWREAERAMNSSRYEEAAAGYERFLERYPKSDRAEQALMLLGDIQHLFLNRYDEAIASYRELVNVYPESKKRTAARLKIAAIYRGKKHDCRSAIVEYEAIIHDEVPPETAAEAQYLLAQCWFEEGEYGQARTEFEALLSSYPKSAFVDAGRYGLAACHYAQRRCSEAMELYRAVIAGGKDQNLVLDSRFGIAACLEEAGKHRDALAAFREILDSYPNRTVVRDRIAAIEARINTLSAPAKPGPGSMVGDLDKP